MSELDGVTQGGLGGNEGLQRVVIPEKHSFLSGHGRGQSMQGRKSGRDPRKETMEEIHASQKPLKLYLRRGPRHGRDGLNLRGKGNDAGGVNDVAKVFDPRLSQKTLFLVDAEAGFLEAMKNFRRS